MTAKKHRLLLGAHMSISGGLEKAIERGASIDCSTIQIFLKSNRQWKAKELSEEEITLFKKTCSSNTITPIVAHATYLINIAAPDTAVMKNSVQALAFEIDRAQQLEIPYLVLHPGSFGASSAQEGIEQIAANLDDVFAQVPGKTMVALELMAGQGSSIGGSFEQLAAIIKAAEHKKRLGVCFDTCHAFAAGYDFRTKKEYEKMWDAFDATIGLERLKVIHVNDSKKPLGSHVDRHEHIGKGQIGLEAFSLLFNDERFFDIPKILETPEATQEPFTEDKMNMATIIKLLTPKTRKTLGI